MIRGGHPDGHEEELERMADDYYSDDVCWGCGGEGFIDGQCTCMDDTCCCLVKDEPICDICKGNGHLK